MAQAVPLLLEQAGAGSPTSAALCTPAPVICASAAFRRAHCRGRPVVDGDLVVARFSPGTRAAKPQSSS